jgi:hypothetical protein
MTRNKIAIAIATLAFSSLSFAVQSGQSVVTAGGFTNGNVGNTISGSVTALNGGFSESQATSAETAAGSIQTSLSKGTTSVGGENVPTQSAGTSGAVSVTSSDTAWNYSTGNAGGSADVNSGSGAVVGGNNVIPNVATGSGYTGVGSTSVIQAGTNQGGYTASADNGNFSSTQTVTANSSSFGVSSALTANATVSNAEGEMTVNGASLSAPSVLSVGDSGTFTATGTGATGINVSNTLGDK